MATSRPVIDRSTTLTTGLALHDSTVVDDQPGLVTVFSVNRPSATAVPLGSEPVIVGRSVEAGVCLRFDNRTSRRHASIRINEDRFEVEDLGSHNGTFLDGERVIAKTVSKMPRTLRVGHTVFLFVSRLGPLFNRGVDVVDNVVIGPALAMAYERLSQVGKSGDNVLLTGPTGVGKELAARHFHESAGDASRPFVAVNCATIPPNLAERLLFGAQRGAYSGADTNAEGYVQAAHGGTLFLDEIAELELSVQAKLLRVLEAREVMPLGATRPKPVKFQLCAATLKDLRQQVAAGSFREDLYHRVARPSVQIPGLAERLEEIPWLVTLELERQSEELAPTAGFIEACLLREWPGNVREFLGAVREAVLMAQAEGRLQLQSTDLLPADTTPPRTAPPHSVDQLTPPGSRKRPPTRDEIVAALRAAAGNVSGAARALGMHRNQLRRWLSSEGLDASTFRDSDSEVTGPDTQRSPGTEDSSEGAPSADTTSKRG